MFHAIASSAAITTRISAWWTRADLKAATIVGLFALGGELPIPGMASRVLRGGALLGAAGPGQCPLLRPSMATATASGSSPGRRPAPHSAAAVDELSSGRRRRPAPLPPGVRRGSPPTSSPGSGQPERHRADRGRLTGAPRSSRSWRSPLMEAEEERAGAVPRWRRAASASPSRRPRPRSNTAPASPAPPRPPASRACLVRVGAAELVGGGRSSNWKHDHRDAEQALQPPRDPPATRPATSAPELRRRLGLSFEHYELDSLREARRGGPDGRNEHAAEHVGGNGVGEEAAGDTSGLYLAIASPRRAPPGHGLCAGRPPWPDGPGSAARGRRRGMLTALVGFYPAREGARPGDEGLGRRRASRRRRETGEIRAAEGRTETGVG